MARRSNFKILKEGGYPEKFSRDKLFKSLKRSGLPINQCKKIADNVSYEIGEGSKTRDIFKKTLRLVKETSPLAATNYSLKKAIFELGPTGHHFETFVAKYFMELGYTTQTCQTLSGRLVNHEIDVIAIKSQKKTLVECKFHNRAGIKNDIKIALYVKARRDDLKEAATGIDQEAFYLASNTSFSSDAIKYANGSNIILLGVNAPNDWSFLDQIKFMNLYPVTSMRRINKMIKSVLLEKNIVLTKEIKNQIPLLRRLGLQETEIKDIINEVDFLTSQKI